eukprot:evm.model.NODE_3377_length_44775_cov_49.092262.11
MAVQDFLGEALEKVKSVEEVVRTMKRNLAAVEGVLREWERPMLERKSKPVEREEFERMQRGIRAERYGKVKEAGKEIEALLKRTHKILQIASPTLPEWRAYVDYVNNRVVNGLSRVILFSLEAFRNEIDPTTTAINTGLTSAGTTTNVSSNKLPMLEIKLTLVDDRQVRFQPELSSSTSSTSSSGITLKDVVGSIVGGFYHLSTLLKRLDDTNNQGNFGLVRALDSHLHIPY